MKSAPVHRRGWCPGMLRPMPTGDGLLVRLHPREGILAVPQVRAIAESARRFGNGFLDVTSRGNLQIRGVRDSSHPSLVRRLLAAGLADEAREDGPYRLTLTSPLAGLDPTDLLNARDLARRIETEAASVRGLPAKMSVAVDGGGAWPLDRFQADLRVVAVDTPRGVSVALGVMSRDAPEWMGTLAPADAPAALRAVLTAFAGMIAGWPSGVRRVRDLPDALRASLVADVALGPVAVPSPRTTGPSAGLIRTSQRQKSLLLVLPYGRCDAAILDEVASWCERFGTGEVRLSPGRGIAVPGIRDAEAAEAIALAADAGLIVAGDDPRLNLVACPGTPACANASTATHRDADRIAAAGGRLLAGGARVHVSGCPKGCALPGPAELTLVGENGVYRVVLGGSPGDTPLFRLPVDAIAARLADVRGTADLMQAFTREQQ